MTGVLSGYNTDYRTLTDGLGWARGARGLRRCLRQRAGLRPAQSRGAAVEKRWRGEEIPWFGSADRGLDRPSADVGAVRDGLPAAAGGSQTRPEQGAAVEALAGGGDSLVRLR